jgi:hypothetical protein
MRKFILGLLVLGALVLPGHAAADQPPLPPTAPSAMSQLDLTLVDVLKEVHNRGADLYNQGDAAGCYRLFQGSLLTIRPLLGHHTEVQKAIDAGLADAERSPDLRRRAFALHKLIEQVRNQIRSEKAEN